MSKTFIPPLRNFAPNKGLLIEENERFNQDRSNVCSNVESFTMPSIARQIGCRKSAFNSGLFLRRNDEQFNGYNDLSEIRPDINEDFNAPSTSRALPAFSGSTQTNYDRFSRNLNVGEARRNNLDGFNRMYDAAARNNTIQTSFLQQNNISSHQNINFRNDSLNKCNTSRMIQAQVRNSTFATGLQPQDEMRCGEDQSRRAFQPAIMNSAFNTGINIQEGLKCSEDISSNGGFRRPTMTRPFRPRNSTITSGLFFQSNVEKCSKDLVNTNGFNVTHISRRGMEIYSESRLPLTSIKNQMDNQSVAGSMMSVSMASVKAQFMNVLENLHFSILRKVPNIPAEAMRTAFDRAKEDLESINEMSLAHTIRETDGASVISHSSRYICPTVRNQTAGTTILDGAGLLKTGKDVLKSLITKNETKNNLLLTKVEEECKMSFQVTKSKQITEEEDDDDNEDTALVFKKPKPFSKRKRKSLPKQENLKIQTPHDSRGLRSKLAKGIIVLKEWYPIAVGVDLMFCGTNDKGAVIQTEAVKKRVNNREVELISGLKCNLIGSPSNSVVTVFPQKVLSQMKNGLTCRWRMFQKDVANCQKIGSGEKSLRKLRKSQEKQVEMYDSTPRGRRLNQLKENNVNDTPLSKKIKSKLSQKAVEAVTTVKTPQKVLENVNIKSSPRIKAIADIKSPPTVKAKADVKSPPTVVTKPNIKSSPRIKAKAELKSPPVVKTTNKSKDTKKSKVSPEKGKKASPKSSAKDLSQRSEKGPLAQTRSGRAVKPPTEFWMAQENNEVSSSGVVEALDPVSSNQRPTSKRLKRKLPEPSESLKQKSEKIEERPSKKRLADKENEEMVKVDSSTDDTKLRKGEALAKRKRKIVGDADSTQRKKIKSEKVAEPVVESTIDDADQPLKTSKRAKKEEQKKNKEKCNESEDQDFEFRLDNMEIPEIKNTSCNLRLNRSQFRLISMETPPLKFFNSNLRIPRSGGTPVQSPDWCISQKTASEVKQFQRRRAIAHKKKIEVDKKKTAPKKTKRTPQNKDLKKVLEWVAEKDVRSPVKGSKLLKYVLPSTKQIQEDDDEEEDEDPVDVFCY